MHRLLLCGAALAAVAAVIFWNPVPLFVTFFLGIVGISETRAGPNLVAAVAAYDSGEPSLGEAAIAVTCWDTDNHYHASLREHGHATWEYEFIPRGWQPTVGIFPARIWRASDTGKPVLGAVESGIMIPRYDPKRDRQ